MPRKIANLTPEERVAKNKERSVRYREKHRDEIQERQRAARSTPEAKAKQREYERQRYEKQGREAATDRKRKWREANPEKVAEYSIRNREKAQEREQRWVAEHREEHNAYHREWAAKRRRENGVPSRHPKRTPEEKRLWHRENYAKNAERRREDQRRYKEANKENKNAEWNEKRNQARLRRIDHYREMARERWKNTPDEKKKKHNTYNRRRYAEDLAASREYTNLRSHRRRAREAGAEGQFTGAEINELYGKQQKQCAACKAKISKSGNTRYHIDHVQPLYRGGSNYISNIQLLCQKCNLSKGCKDPDIWAREQGLLFL